MALEVHGSSAFYFVLFLVHPSFLPKCLKRLGHRKLNCPVCVCNVSDVFLLLDDIAKINLKRALSSLFEGKFL